MYIQEIPKEQKQTLIKALNLLEASLTIISEEDNQENDYVIFDIMVLRALLNYKVEIKISESELETFTESNGVDFPKYSIPIEKVVDTNSIIKNAISDLNNHLV